MQNRMNTSTHLCENVFEQNYTTMHICRMSEPTIENVPKLLKALMETIGVKQEGLAEALDVDQPQISRWISGSPPNGPNFSRIINLARERGLIDDVRSEDVAASLSDTPRRTVKLKGYVGASGEAFYYRVGHEDLEEVPAPDNANDHTVAVEVRGKSLGPALESWLVYYEDVRSPITPDLHNQLCVVGLADDRLLVKKIEKRGGKFVLVSNNGDPDIENANIEWAAKVTSMRPRH
jgi:hypothetical protein